MDAITVDMNLHFLSDFLRHIEEAVTKRIEEIESKVDDCEIEDYGEYECLVDYPIFHSKFGAKVI